MKLTDLVSEIPIWESWCESYNKFVPSFVKEASTKVKWEDWDQEVFNEFFEQARDQCVSSLQQGYYTNDEKLKIKAIWAEIGPLLKKIADSQDRLQIDIYTELSALIRKQTTQNRVASANRLIASLQPKLLCTIVNNSKLNELIYFLNKEVENCNIKTQGNWFEKSNAVLNFFTSELNKPAEEIMTLPWQVYAHFKNLQNANSNDMSDSYLNIDEVKALLNFKKQIILQGPPGTGKTKLAKELAKAIVHEGISETEIDFDQIQIVQFHPSYSYEDFVRGIVIQPNKTGEGLIYEPENKIFGKIIELAKTNKVESKKDQQTVSKENWVDKQIDKFAEKIKNELEGSNRKPITGKVDIVGVEENAFRYKGKKGWSKLGNRILFEDLVQAWLDENTTRQDVKLNKNLSGLANWHATYYIKVLDDFRSFLKENNLKFENDTKLESFEQVVPKNYVLIIDELNRANLSSVLGELIYALEYRNEKVASIYAVEGDNEIQIPDNLYLIGTMNTADRSVSQIDYAIRRRFAFVDVLPKDLTSELSNDFKSELFKSVAELFVKKYDTTIDYTKEKQIEKSDYLSDEFNPIDVWLGHSYFIQQYEKDKNGDEIKEKPIDFKLRLDFEIKPILREYVKDGILKQNALAYIEDLSC